MPFKTYFAEWTTTTYDMDGRPSSWEKNYGNGLAGVVGTDWSFGHRAYRWVLYMIDGPTIDTAVEIGPEEAFRTADRVAASEPFVKKQDEWRSRPIVLPHRGATQSTLRIEPYRRPR